ncbi:lipid A export permease/ATP-binding protein MsbA [Shewanella yunxiaonensis]|uniref:Lipid A export permease/ATP-binding protein MsbA n=1 Tax=Shewanella yunxiaonensis TaxID=2829809 RepID=A0ABX7YZ63_9GAMM|nr:lipid A export permease/ATP-binding protein MsbA [Shewanella yunxiaonensis]QUN07549.1 lipid A export permease/ATP-binding protein MsbA [Shewanella yunxiaonensis]
MANTPKNETWIVFKRLVSYVQHLKKVFIISVLGLLGYGAVDVTFMGFIKPFVDEGFAPKSAVTVGTDIVSTQGFQSGNDVLAMAPFIVVGLFILRGLFNFISTYGISYMSTKVIQEMRQQVFEHILKLPVSYMDQQNSGSLISKVTYDTEQIARASGNALITIVRDGITVIGMIGMMFFLSWKLSIFILVIAPAIALVITIVSRRFRKVSRQIQNAMGSVTTVTEQMIKGHKNVLVFGGQKTEAERFEKANDFNRYQNMKLATTQAISQPLVMIIGSFALGAVIFAASLDSLRGELTAGIFTTVLACMLSMLQPIKNLTRINAEFQRGITACTTVFELLDTPPEQDNGHHEVERVLGNVSFRHVDFRYPGQENRALKNVSFDVKQGHTLALVGRSGSGKSTIASLLTRFYSNLEQGDILLDDVSIYDYSLKCLRSQVALVSQQVTLFNDTIANNIAYAYPGTASREQVEDAARLAYATEFIEKLPKGLDTEIGENGVTLSGGQRQRIAIARAILRDAPVLILDEATSALDTESEKAIQKGLDNLRRDRTSIVIAHRLSTIENADEILVVDQGQIVERGNHKTLLAQDGMYAKLYQMQFGS